MAEVLVAGGRDVAAESEAGCGAHRLRESIDQLFNGGEVLRFPITQVLQVDTGEGVGVLFCTEPLVKFKQERVSPLHVTKVFRLRSEGSRWAFYGAGLVHLGIQPCRSPRPKHRS